MEEYVTRRVSSKNYKDIRYLFKERGLKYSEEFIEKKFDTSFTGIKDIGFIAYHSQTGEPASHYSVFPCLIQKKEKKILGAQSGDTITHPRHQQKGLFVRLAKECYEFARESGVEIIYGFPNQNSYHGFINRLGWIYSEEFISFEIPVQAVPVYRAASKLQLGKSVYHSLIKFLTLKNVKARSTFLNSVLQ